MRGETEAHQEVAENTPISAKIYASVENPSCGIAATHEQGSNEEMMMLLNRRRNQRSLSWLSTKRRRFMRKLWIGLAVCAGAAGFLAWGSSQPTQAAMMIGGSQANSTSIVDQVRARKRAKAA